MSWVTRLKKAIMGEKKKKKKEFTTVRTKAVSNATGLTPEELKKLRGK
jgi:hypothetical protein